MGRMAWCYRAVRLKLARPGGSEEGLAAHDGGCGARACRLAIGTQTMATAACLPRPVTPGSLGRPAVGPGGDGGKPDHEPGATAAAGTFGPHPAAVGLDDRPSDGQPEPAATAGVAGAGRVDPEKALEHPLQQLGGNPPAVVGHRQLELIAKSPGGEVDATTRRRVAQG